GQRREVADPQRRIQILVNMVDATRQAGHVGMGAGRQWLQVSRYSAQANDPLVVAQQRLLPGQAPAFFTAWVEMKLELSVDRPPRERDRLVLRRKAIAEHSRKYFVGKA